MSMKSIRQLGAELAAKHGVADEYGRRIIAGYFQKFLADRSLLYLKHSRALNPIETRLAPRRSLSMRSPTTLET